MPEGFFRVDFVVVPATVTRPGDESRSAEIRDEALDRPFGYPHTNGYIPGPNRGILMDADQDMSVVRQKGPFRSAQRRVTAVSSHGITGTSGKHGVNGSSDCRQLFRGTIFM